MKIFRPSVGGSIDARILRSYRQVAAAVGQDRFIDEIDGVIRDLGRATRWYFFQQRWDADLTAPLAYTFRHEPGLPAMVDDYVDRFYRSDPLNDVLGEQGSASRIIVSVAPRDIRDADYRTRYLQRHDIVQRLSLAEQQGGSWKIMNVGRAEPTGDLSDREIDDLWAFSQLVFPLVEKHCELTSDARVAQIDIGEVERLVAARCPALTTREMQVSARTAIGLSCKSIARELGIGVESVSTYRKRAYARLGVTGAEQLSRRIFS